DDLDDTDLAILRQYSYKLRHHATDDAYRDLRNVFPHNDVPSLDTARTRIAELASFKPQVLDCCINSCCCFTGAHANLDACPFCHEKRYKADQRARKHFTYLPIIPRLRAMAASKAVATQMQYRSSGHVPTPGTTSDVFDGKRYRRLQREYVVVDGKKMPHKFFEDDRDIALGLSTDGFAPFRRRKTTC
ncbi:hypothetical protein FA95DRAFT_1472281, partial [Auriscalpium vulgare]